MPLHLELVDLGELRLRVPLLHTQMLELFLKLRLKFADYLTLSLLQLLTHFLHGHGHLLNVVLRGATEHFFVRSDLLYRRAQHIFE